ncbi:excisionase family DNA-binding protein [Kitasatospora sp. NBC_00458]|uniref:excisionase family DNA-binding protein n=1 Tax=Kitasatospora sp. NBC_00458 TaxID=2903568 RepID=UPI002E190E1D
MDRLLTIKEVAERRGTWESSGERFPRRLVAERRIAFVKVGRHVRITESALVDYVAANTAQPRSRRLRSVA